MIRCHVCGHENPDDVFWCQKCETKLVNRFSPHKKELTHKSTHPSISFDPDTYREQKSLLKKVVVAFIIILVFLALFVFIFVNYNADEFRGITCTIGEDFWFEEEILYTSDGWVFTLTKVQNYTLEGIILGMKTYDQNDFPYKPINVFSPLDLVIATGSVQDHPEDYPHSIRFYDRGYWINYLGDDPSAAGYMRTHMGNNHLIPHNEEVLAMMNNISLEDNVIINGSLVHCNGIRGNDEYHWTTDIAIGNDSCEIILVDDLTVIVQ